MWSNLALLAGSAIPVLAQVQSSPHVLSPGTVLDGDYSGTYRPQIHFSPPQGFINDPNGMFLDENGVYHVYFQYNPTQTIAGYQHWGHTTSRDLYTWENQAIVLAPTSDVPGIFTGSAVIDVNNTSGFFPNQSNGVVAIYTAAGVTEQAQAIAYSFDDGYTFTKYARNSVLSVGSPQFRDPKVFWYEDHWVMVLAFAQEFVLGIYTSPNLINWEFASNFSHHGLLGTQYECPNLVEMPVEDSDKTYWLIYLSIQPGAPLGGSIGQYFIGDFNGTHFTAIDAAARLADWGKDNYAAQFFYNIPASQEQVSIAWASNWQYCNLVPTGPTEGWQSAMSLPRSNYLRDAPRVGWVLVSLPYNLAGLRNSPVVASSTTLGPTGTLYADLSSSSSSSSSGSGAFLIDVNVTNFNASGLPPTASINFTLLASGSGESIIGGTFMATDATMWVDRGNVRAFDNIYYVDKFSTGFVVRDTYDFQIVVDRSIVELFSSRGEKSATLVYYPEALLDTVVIKVGGLNEGVGVSARVYQLQGTWPGGVVRANGTDVYRPGSNGTGGVRRRGEYEMDGQAWGA